MTARRSLTAKAVEALKPNPEKRLEIPDPALAGLYLIIQQSGAKSWAVRYRFEGRPKKLTLGRWPIVTLAQARIAATEALEAVDHGEDPAAAKRAAKASQGEGAPDRDKVASLLEQFRRRHLSTIKSGEHAYRFLERLVLPAWGDRNIATITRRDVVDLLDEISDSGRATTANRVRAHVSKFFNWCTERDVIPVSPANGIRAPRKEVSRDRVLSDAEIRWFWLACERQFEPWGALGQLLLLTGQRLNEVAQMTDDEIEGNLWRLPAVRVKNGRAHDVALSVAALDVLERKMRISGSGRFIFTTTGRSPLQGFHKGREHLADAMLAVAQEETGEAVEIPHWTFHDLRRTAATGMARLGIAVRVTESVLNHVSGTAGGIVSVYQRHDYANEKRDALDAWARMVNEIVEGRSENVVRLR